ncbi:MAG: DUF4290 domain-containing protein [Alistipes sp.]|nr:DUF4290 domain-containing protein [Alistipes sp.]
MRKNYNYKRRKLYMPEYGRHIHEMVDSLFEIEDRQERTRQAKAVIAVMGNLNPLLRDTADFKHKLWDHLFIMSDFKLDVDSPYQQPSRQELMVRPEKLQYPQSRIMFKHYGKYAQRFVRAIAAEQKSHRANDEMMNMARYMRAKSYEYNNEHPNNEAIIRDIRIMAGGNISIDLDAINAMRSEYRQNQPSRNMKGRKQQQRNGRKQQRNTQKNQSRHNAHK